MSKGSPTRPIIPPATGTPSTPKGGGDGPPQTPSDRCDHDFTTPLVGIQPEAVGRVKVGDRLEVALQPGQRGFFAVVCRIHADGAVVGSVANVAGLDELMRCLGEGVRYAARVVSHIGTNITVRINRSSP